MNIITKIIAFFAIVIIIAPIFIYTLVTNAFVTQCAWGWFITPIFDVAPLGWYGSFCVAAFASTFTFRYSAPKPEDPRSSGEQMMDALLKVAAKPLIVLVVLFLTHLAIEAFFN